MPYRFMKKTSLQFTVLSLCIGVMTVIVCPANTYAHVANSANNPYYAEVSQISHAISDNFPETVREAGYDVFMTGVFGEHYRDWDFKNHSEDLIRELTRKEYDQISCGILQMSALGKSIIFGKGSNNERIYYCTSKKIPLNDEGINEQNYIGLKKLYQSAEELKQQTVGMDDVTKAKTIHDYIAASLTYSDTEKDEEYCVVPGFLAGKGVCQIYAMSMYIFGRYCGLEVGIVDYISDDGIPHGLNTLVVDGETRYIDVTWDDVLNTTKYFMETESQYYASHPRQ